MLRTATEIPRAGGKKSFFAQFLPTISKYTRSLELKNWWHGANVLVSETESCLAKALNWIQLKEVENS